ncbi:V-type ATP synthase subunit D [Salinibacterium sp. TMP30]|uniref:V-type ATP synthase subunit D n=1 Tax=Salinibacterium sp. TMP30 TaxID=3138237 RepID=UPI003139C46E
MNETGRSGKARVAHQLETARHGSTLLDRKQHILADELERLELFAEHSRRRWEDLARVAATWLQRSAEMDGRDRIEAAAADDPVVVEVHWGGAMGVSYPENVTVQLPPERHPGGSSALSYAAQSHRDSLVAAAQCAAASRALLLVSTELTTTRLRQRAIENTWIPRLEAKLISIQGQLDQQELEESLRVRWAENNRSGADRARTADSPIPQLSGGSDG